MRDVPESAGADAVRPALILLNLLELDADLVGQLLLRDAKHPTPLAHPLFVFLDNRARTATNNGSERALRPCVTFRKVTKDFRSTWGADLYANVRSVLETARRPAIVPL